MIRISITPAAFEAIAATLPLSVGIEGNRAPNGDRYIWLDPKYVERLRAIRRPGESYSDVILRVWRTGEPAGAGTCLLREQRASHPRRFQCLRQRSECLRAAILEALEPTHSDLWLRIWSDVKHMSPNPASRVERAR